MNERKMILPKVKTIKLHGWDCGQGHFHYKKEAAERCSAKAGRKPYTPLTCADRKQIKAYRDEGRTFVEIAKIFDRSATRIADIYKIEKRTADYRAWKEMGEGKPDFWAWLEIREGKGQ